MSYGLWVLTKIAKLNDTQANAGTMSIHIVAYLLCILAGYSAYIDLNSVKAFEISDISILITNLFSSLMLAWVVCKLNQNTGVLATFETQPAQETNFVDEDPFDNAAFALLYKKMRITYRSSMFNKSIDSNAEVEYLDESSIDMSLRPSLDRDRLLDTNDDYLSMLGLPHERQAHRSYNV